MGGRNGEPVDLLLLKGKKHLTKEEITERKNHEKKLKSGSTTVRANDKVKNSEIAYKTFRKLKRLYDGIDIIDALDENIINRYCLLTAEIELQEILLSKMNDDVFECEEYTERISLYQTIASAERILIRTRAELLKLEDRLLLNPVARIKNVPKKEKPKPKSEFDQKFGDI